MQWWIQGVSEVSGNQPNLEQQPLVNRGLSICGNAFPASLHKPAAFISVIKGALSHFRILLSILLIILNNCTSYSSFGC